MLLVADDIVLRMFSIPQLPQGIEMIVSYLFMKERLSMQEKDQWVRSRSSKSTVCQAEQEDAAVGGNLEWTRIAPWTERLFEGMEGWLVRNSITVEMGQ